MNGFSLVTSADTSSVGSISQRDPVGVAGSDTGRNALGNTSAPIAALTAERSDSRCGLNPAPIESMPMMICVFRSGGGAVLRVVSVLCGAGGGLTAQPASVSVETSTPMVSQARRARFGTPNRVSGPRG